jgi:glutamine amidotransferase
MIAIVKYNAGNVQSVQYALNRIGVESIVTDNAAAIINADKVIFPGVGNAASAMQYLKERELDKLLVALQQPVLGICLGLQLLCSHSEEGDTDCLGVFDTTVKLFPQRNLKVPHVGWNNIAVDNTLFEGLQKNTFVYYVHSYYAAVSAQTIATTEYILPFAAALRKDNFYAVQFHPERSGEAGETILKNFINIK